MATQVLVLWTYALSDNTGFLLQRSVDSASTWPVQVATTASVTQYTDSDVSVGNTYWYHVAATNPYGTGSFSNTASVFLETAGPVTISIAISATPETKSYDGTTSSFQAPIISSGSLAPGDTTASFAQFYVNKLVNTGVVINPTGSLLVTSGNAYDIVLIPDVGDITGPTGSVNGYIVVPTDTNLPIDDGWLLDIQGMAVSGSSYFLTQEWLEVEQQLLVMTSSNCVSWSVATTSSVLVFSNAYAYASGTFLGIGIAAPSYDVGTQFVQYSTNKGETWNSASIPGLSQNIWDVIHDGTRFIAGGDAGTILTSSLNGLTWSLSTTGGTDRVRRLLFRSGRYFALGENSVLSSGTIYTSTDLVTWTPVSSSVATTNGYRDITYSPALGIYLAVGEGGLMATSSNGTVWSDHSNPDPILTDYLKAVAWNSTTGYFSVANTQGYTFTSPDAITWTLDTITPQYSYHGNFYSNVARMTYSPTLNKIVIFGTAPPV